MNHTIALAAPRPSAWQPRRVRVRLCAALLACCLVAMPVAAERAFAAPGDVQAMTLADVPVLVAAPARVDANTPMLLMLHGLGRPASPQALAQALPPSDDAITAYLPLPFSAARGAPDDALAGRQQEDYVVALVDPLLTQAARDIDTVVVALRQRFALAGDSPVVTFGFSIGGAAVLRHLTTGNVAPRAVVALNAPLGIRQAVALFEARTGRVYDWTEPARAAAQRYDLVAQATAIRRRHPGLHLVLLQSDDDAPLTVDAAAGAARALADGGTAEAVMLTGTGHNFLGELSDGIADVSPAGVARDRVQRELAGALSHAVAMAGLSERDPSAAAASDRLPRD